MYLGYGSFCPYYCFPDFSIRKKDTHLSIEEPVAYIRCSPVTLALTGSSCSFLFLPNIISMELVAE
jgi:hypothetical protein